MRLCNFMAVFACAAFCAQWASADSPKYDRDDYRNFFGICWRGSPQENIDYARQMGYTSIFYRNGMEKCKNAAGMKFYLESPEYATYTRAVDVSKKYSPEEIRKFETFAALKDASKPFPENLATGWFMPPNGITIIPDFQQKKVIDRTVDKIIEHIRKIEKARPGFKFAGAAWDVPQAEGDFWTGKKGNPMSNGRQVPISHWTGSGSASKHPDVTHDYPTHELGHYEFYRKLFERCRAEINPDSKFIVEPYRVYDGWVKDIEKLAAEKGPEEAKKYMADFVCEEGSSTQFVEDERNFKSGLYKKDQVSSSTPNFFDEASVRKISGVAAANGAWTHWFGRPGATGNMPDYKTIRDVPARIKLAKALPVWENINNTPLSERKWDGQVYVSPTAGMSEDAVYAVQPGTQKLFFVFNTPDGIVRVPQGYRVARIYFTDGLFREFKGSANYPIKSPMLDSFIKYENSELSPKDRTISGLGFIADLVPSKDKTDSEK